MPGENDASEYLWGSERIYHPASSHKMTGSPTVFNGSQWVKDMVFPNIFSSCERGFLGFYIHVFPIFSSYVREVFEVLFFMF